MTIPAEQRAVADYLTRLSGAPPKETHISAVFVGKDTVWKLKKAVHLPFLDFSQVDAREKFLRRELSLNQPAAPGLYRDVIAISRQQDGSLELGGTNPVDWVLRMAPVPEHGFLDVIAADGGLTPRLLDELGDCVAAYHTALAPVAHQDSATTLMNITEGNVRSARAAGLPPADIENWHQVMLAAIDARRPWLTQRAATGYVRRCHGDLHLGNLCIWDGRPVAFDALEFDEALATIDVGYDLAFLLMDLDCLKDRTFARAASNRVMNRYIARTGDIATTGYPIFLSQRAMIRAHVRQSMQRDGSSYLAAALTYPRPAPPTIIAIGGLQGTGKSTLARALAPEIGPAPGALIVRSDEVRKRLHGAGPETRLPPAAYTDTANARTNRTLIEMATTAAASRHSVVVDATFLDVAMRGSLETVARAAGVPFLGIWLHAPLEVLRTRVAARQGDASDATVAVLLRSIRDDPGAGAWLPVEASDGAAAWRAVRAAIRTVSSRAFSR